MNETNIPTLAHDSDALESHVAEDLVVPPETMTACAGRAVIWLLGNIFYYFIKLCEWYNDSDVAQGMAIMIRHDHPQIRPLPP
jgi:hypothetical protein